MEEDDPPRNENSYLDKTLQKIVFKRNAQNRVFHTRHTRRIAYPRTGQYVVADIGTEISHENLVKWSDKEKDLPLTLPFSSSGNHGECPAVALAEPRVEPPVNFESGQLPERGVDPVSVLPTAHNQHHPTHGLASIPEKLEPAEPEDTVLPDPETNPLDPPVTDAYAEDSDSWSGTDDDIDRIVEKADTRYKRKVRVQVENNHRQDRRPDHTKPSYQSLPKSPKFYQPGFVQRLMERAGTIGLSQVPKWQQDGIDLIQDVSSELNPIYRCLNLADSILHTPVQGSNVSKVHNRLVYCFLYIGLMVKLVLPEYHESERFLEHIFVHLSKIESTATTNIKLCQKIERRAQDLLGRLIHELDHEIYTGILSLNIKPPDPGKGRGKGLEEVTTEVEDEEGPVPVKQSDPDEFTLVISSFTSSLLITCKESPELGSTAVKDLAPLQLLCLIQILLEDLSRSIQLVSEQMESGLTLFNSIGKLKESLRALKVHLNYMRKDMFLRPNNCSRALSQALKRIANENAALKATLHSVGQISRWTLEASECIFAEARMWSPGTKMESPYQSACSQRRKGFGVLKQCFGTNRDILEGHVRTFQQLFAAVEGTQIVDALQMLVPVHKSRKEFLFREHFDRDSSEMLVFGDESMASLTSGTLSILQFRPVDERADKPEPELEPEAEVLTNTVATGN